MRTVLTGISTRDPSAAEILPPGERQSSLPPPTPQSRFGAISGQRILPKGALQVRRARADGFFFPGGLMRQTIALLFGAASIHFATGAAPLMRPPLTHRMPERFSGRLLLSLSRAIPCTVQNFWIHIFPCHSLRPRPRAQPISAPLPAFDVMGLHLHTYATQTRTHMHKYTNTLTCTLVFWSAYCHLTSQRAPPLGAEADAAHVSLRRHHAVATIAMSLCA